MTELMNLWDCNCLNEFLRLLNHEVGELLGYDVLFVEVLGEHILGPSGDILLEMAPLNTLLCDWAFIVVRAGSKYLRPLNLQYHRPKVIHEPKPHRRAWTTEHHDPTRSQLLPHTLQNYLPIFYCANNNILEGL